MTPEDDSEAVWSRQTEQATLGSMLLAKNVIGEVLEVVCGRDFYDPKHEVMFEAIIALYAAGEPADAITLAAELMRRGEIGKIGVPYIHTCIGSTTTGANGAYYAKHVAELAVKRRMVEAGTRIRQMGLATGLDDIPRMLEAAAAELAKAQPRVQRDTEGLAQAVESVLEEMENPGTATAFHTGLRALDEVYRGAAPGRLDVFAARPGVGKSVLATVLIRAVALRLGVPTLLFSLEMSAHEIVQRIISAEAKVNLHRITDPLQEPPDQGDWARMAKVMGPISEAPIHIRDHPVGLLEIQRETRRAVQQLGVRLVIVDYLQLMLQPRNAESRQVGVGANADGLKLLGKELDVAVVALSQLNRNPAARGNGVPRLSDLRESGSIEQSADSVILIHRPDMEEPESPRAGEADLIVAKQRNGRTGIATVVFQGHYARFSDFAPEPSY